MKSGYIQWVGAAIAIGLYGGTALDVLQRYWDDGLEGISPKDLVSLLLPLAVILIEVMRRRSGRTATWVIIHREQIALVLFCIALFTAIVLWEPLRLGVSVLSVVLFGALGWYLLDQLAASRSSESLEKQPVSTDLLLADDLTDAGLSEDRWDVRLGQPPMLTPTPEGLLTRWSSGTIYHQSGQLLAPLPEGIWRVEASLLAQTYGTGWDSGLYLYGDDEFPALLGVGFMPAGHPVAAPQGKTYTQKVDGLAVGVGVEGDPNSYRPIDKFPVLLGKWTRVRIEGQAGDATVYCDGSEFWSGAISGTPRLLCVGPFRWPWEQEPGPAGQSAEYLIRNVRVTALGGDNE